MIGDDSSVLLVKDGRCEEGFLLLVVMSQEARS